MIVEWLVALLLLLSGALALIGALGLVSLRDFFLRMHAPSLAATLGSWSATLASVLYFAAGPGSLQLHLWLIVILLAMTVPVTTVLLSRAALFRQRNAGDALPPPLAVPEGERGGAVTESPRARE
jgi:multicomponent K+:H+ antiporter subunit G